MQISGAKNGAKTIRECHLYSLCKRLLGRSLTSKLTFTEQKFHGTEITLEEMTQEVHVRNGKQK